MLAVAAEVCHRVAAAKATTIMIFGGKSHNSLGCDSDHKHDESQFRANHWKKQEKNARGLSKKIPNYANPSNFLFIFLQVHVVIDSRRSICLLQH